jgi:hypothetical protein
LGDEFLGRCIFLGFEFSPAVKLELSNAGNTVGAFALAFSVGGIQFGMWRVGGDELEAEEMVGEFVIMTEVLV